MKAVQWYLQGIYIVFTWSTSFTGDAYYICQGIYNLHAARSKFSKKSDKVGGKSAENLNKI